MTRPLLRRARHCGPTRGQDHRTKQSHNTPTSEEGQALRRKPESVTQKTSRLGIFAPESGLVRLDSFCAGAAGGWVEFGTMFL